MRRSGVDNRTPTGADFRFMPPETSPKPKTLLGFKPVAAIRCLLAMAPFPAVFLLTGDREALTVGILGGGLFIACERLGLGVRLMLLHYVLALAAFAVLLACVGHPVWFTVMAAVLASAVVAATRDSAKLRSFGNWIFLPAVYLACELGGRVDGPERMALLPSVLLYSLLAPVSVGLLRKLWPNPDLAAVHHSLGDVRRRFPEPNPDWVRHSVAAFASVLLVTGIAEALQLPNRQWMIWSALSVIALSRDASRIKIKDRLFGVLVGCPLGLLVGLMVPPNEIAYSLAILLIFITLVAFEHYRIAFTTRCALVAFAALMAGGSFAIGEERMINVIFGGCVGVVILQVALWRRKIHDE